MQRDFYGRIVSLCCGDVSAVAFFMRRSEVEKCGVVGYEGKSRWVALLDGYKSTRGDMCVIEKPECERFVCPVVYHPPLFSAPGSSCPFIVCAPAPLLCVQFDGSARALMPD